MADALPNRNDWLFGWFAWYVRGFVRRHFHAVRLLGDNTLRDPAIVSSGQPLIVYLNHPGWWDPMMAVYLADRYLNERKHAAPIDVEALEKYRVFRSLGFFGVEPGSATGGRKFLRTAEACLDAGWVVWVTAQGKFSDPRERPVELMPGLSHLVKRRAKSGVATAGWVLPVALEYPFWNERTPEALVNVGEPLAVSSFAGESTEVIDTRLSVALTAAMDDLASAAVARDLKLFSEHHDGRAGVGGWYDVWRRLSCLLRGQRFRPAHELGLKREDEANR